MPDITIRNARESDFESIVRLNDTEVRQTSAMDLERLRLLDLLSAYHKVAIVDGRVAAFLLAMRDGAAYRNDNFEWFASRFPSFLYVDRIVVGSDFSGQRIGSTLYKDLFAFAQSRKIGHVVCEYNIEPPNPASKAFHDKFGFTEVGTQWVAGGTKRVSLQAAAV